jgi:hypothetical protein
MKLYISTSLEQLTSEMSILIIDLSVVFLKTTYIIINFPNSFGLLVEESSFHQFHGWTWCIELEVEYIEMRVEKHARFLFG